jgi:hypothetical protein
MLVMSGERVTSSHYTPDDSVSLPFSYPVPIVVSDGKIGTVMRKFIHRKNPAASSYANTGI